MSRSQIDIPKEAIEELCRKNRIYKISLFGSVLREDFHQRSDIDMLVEFEQGSRHGFLDMARMERELSEMLGRDVDLKTPFELSEYFKDEVMASAEVQYVHR